MNTIVFAAADRRLVAGILVAIGFTLVAVFLIASSMSSKRRRMEVPHALRPGPSDEELEQKTLPRFLAIGSLFLLLMSLFFPAYWLREPTRIKLKVKQFKAASIHRGEIIYQPAVPGAPHFSANCAACHGASGEGAIQPFKEIFRVAEPPLKYIVARYKAAGRNEDEIRQLIRDAIERGRPGTKMPTWGLLFGGPLNSEQVDDVTNYIYSIQGPFPKAPVGMSGAQLFENFCATCHTRPDDPTTPDIVEKFPTAGGGAGPDLRTVFSQYHLDELREIISEGKLNTNRVSMPAWAHLGDETINSILKFLLSLQTGAIKPVPSPTPGA